MTRLTTTLLVLLSTASLAQAQVPAATEGFTLVSPDGGARLRVGGYLHFDGRTYPSDAEQRTADQFLFRRARVLLDGKLWERFEFRLMPDFAGGRLVLQDAYVDVKVVEALNVRVGKFKVPFGLERLQSATAMSFIERAFPTSLSPNRDLGLQVHGSVFGGALAYQLGIFNGVADGGSGDGDISDDKELAARVFVKPLSKTGVPLLTGLGLGVAATVGEKKGSAENTELTALRTTGQLSFFSWRAASDTAEGVVAAGSHRRLGLQGNYYAGGLGVWAELVWSQQQVSLGEDVAVVPERAWQLAASYVIGGKNSERGVKLDSGFNPLQGGFGALEIAARISQLRIGDQAFTRFADSSRAARGADELSGGVRWHLGPAFKVALDLARTTFDGGAAEGADRSEELALLGRAQLAF
ncbi:MAG: porin [Myxococcaceae bacterium]